jgi:hypothetical protein
MGAEGLHATRKVAAGFVSFTEILDGEHRSYNEWHMLDHMPEQHPIPGIVSGERWVVSPACASARFAAAEPFDAVHYFTLYLLAEPVVDTVKTFYALGQRLSEVGRFHEKRRSHLAAPLRVSGQWASPRVHVSELAVPHRPNRGVFVVVERHDEPGSGEPAGDHVAALLRLDGVAGVWTFASDASLGRTRHAEGAWRVAVAWLDADPLAVTESAGDRLVAGLSTPGASPVLAGPLEAIEPWEWSWFDD